MEAKSFYDLCCFARDHGVRLHFLLNGQFIRFSPVRYVCRSEDVDQLENVVLEKPLMTTSSGESEPVISKVARVIGRISGHVWVGGDGHSSDTAALNSVLLIDPQLVAAAGFSNPKERMYKDERNVGDGNY